MTRLGTGNTVIGAEDWDRARIELEKTYSESTMLPLCLNIIDTFDKVNRIRYRSDWETFLHESRMEDFMKRDEQTVMVSTMHKAKGHEFDQVFLMLDGFDLSTDEGKRIAYVAMTRARHSLRVHTNCRMPAGIMEQASITTRAEETYGLPEEILLQLTHRDVALSSFRTRQIEIRAMRCGDELVWRDKRLWLKKKPDGAAIRLSAAFLERIRRLENKGYRITSASVRSMVFWNPDDDNPGEIMIVLPDLVLTYQGEGAAGSGER